MGRRAGGTSDTPTQGGALPQTKVGTSISIHDINHIEHHPRPLSPSLRSHCFDDIAHTCEIPEWERVREVQVPRYKPEEHNIAHRHISYMGDKNAPPFMAKSMI
jgi:hypothetical protein